MKRLNDRKRPSSAKGWPATLEGQKGHDIMLPASYHAGDHPTPRDIGALGIWQQIANLSDGEAWRQWFALRTQIVGEVRP